MENNEPIYLSASRLKIFLSCPRRFRYQYTERAEPAFRAMALAFGSAFHTAVGSFLLDPMPDHPMARERAHQVFRDALQKEIDEPGPPIVFDDEGENIEQSVDVGIRMLDVLTTRVLRSAKVLAVELAFEMDLVHPDTGEVVGVPFVGAIDAIVERESRPILLEFKTGKKRWSADQIEFDLQPTIYRLAGRSRGYLQAEVELVLTTKSKQPDVQFGRAPRSDADTRELVETAGSIVDAIRNGVEYRQRSWQCRTCPFADRCAP